MTQKPWYKNSGVFLKGEAIKEIKVDISHFCKLTDSTETDCCPDNVN